MPNSVDVTALTSILPPLPDTRALEAVRSAVVTVDIAPAMFAVRLDSKAALLDAATVTFAFLLDSNPSICVCIALVTPSKYPSSVDVTSDTAIFCEPLDITALSAVKLFSVNSRC